MASVYICNIDYNVNRSSLLDLIKVVLPDFADSDGALKICRSNDAAAKSRSKGKPAECSCFVEVRLLLLICCMLCLAFDQYCMHCCVLSVV